VGTVAVWIGLPWALAAGALLSLVVAGGLVWWLPALRRLD
jgi:hypothetical protein